MHPWSEKKAKRADKGAIASNKRRIMAPFLPPKGPKSDIFNASSNGSISKNVVPAEGGEHFSKNVSENYKKERA